MAKPKLPPTRVNHTPGPWRWYGCYLVQDIPGIDDPFSTPHGAPIADDGSAGGEYSATIDPAGPDGCLIAAAPDLLEAAEGLDNFAWAAVTADCEESRQYLQSKIDALRAAIAKTRAPASEREKEVQEEKP